VQSPVEVLARLSSSLLHLFREDECKTNKALSQALLWKVCFILRESIFARECRCTAVRTHFLRSCESGDGLIGAKRLATGAPCRKAGRVRHSKSMFPVGQSEMGKSGLFNTILALRFRCMLGQIIVLAGIVVIDKNYLEELDVGAWPYACSLHTEEKFALWSESL